MVSRLLTRSQLAGVTLSVLLTTHHHPFSSSSSSSSSSSAAAPFSTTTTTTATKENVHPFSFNKEKLPENVVHLKCKSSAQPGFCDVYLVGTNHISQRSCTEVQTVINSLKPEVVFLELCGKRQAMLKMEHLVGPTTEDIIWNKETGILGMLISLIYAEIARELKIIPGSEFRVAYEEAMKYGGKVVLGDRPIEITLTRAWRKMPLSEKIRLFSLSSRKDGSSSTEDHLLSRLPSRKDCSSLTEFLHKLVEMSDEMNMDLVTLVIQELSKRSPTILETLIHERDLFMSYALFQVAKESSCVVAVVGKAHLEGIKKHWQQPVSVINLLTVPPPRDTAKILTSVGVVVIGLVMIRKYGRFKT